MKLSQVGMSAVSGRVVKPWFSRPCAGIWRGSGGFKRK
jgi:hypothetical protein